MSNPYDPYNNQGTPGDPPPPPPYGAPIGSQGGGGGAYPPSPYSQDSPYGDNAPKKTDAVSITGFVLSLTCCLSIVGAILGFIGLKRTKDNQRKGRWAAIAASIIGVLGTLAFIGIILVVVVFAKSVVSIDEASAGTCVNVSTDDNDGVVLLETKCTESHDGEIIYAGDAGDDAATLESNTEAGNVCIGRLDQSVLDTLSTEDLDLNVLVENPSDVGASDRFVCYVEPGDGKKISKKLLD